MGLLERTERKRRILIPLKNRKEQTLIEITQRYVLPGTTIYTDGWRGYRNIGSYGYNHYIVYHNYQFVVPGTEIHTNTIEGLWSALKEFKKCHANISSRTLRYRIRDF